MDLSQAWTSIGLTIIIALTQCQRKVNKTVAPTGDMSRTYRALQGGEWALGSFPRAHPTLQGTRDLGVEAGPLGNSDALI